MYRDRPHADETIEERRIRVRLEKKLALAMRSRNTERIASVEQELAAIDVFVKPRWKRRLDGVRQGIWNLFSGAMF